MRENRISVFRKHTLGILVALGMVLFGSVFILFTNIGKNKATVAAEETLQFIKEQSSRSEAFAEFYQGLHLEMNGIIMICKNGLVTGSNFEEYQGKTQAEAPLIQNITEETEPDTLFSFRYYGSAYFGVFESYGENDLYVFYPVASVFFLRTLALAYVMILYILLCSVFLWLRQREEKEQEEREMACQEAVLLSATKEEKANAAKSDFLRKLSSVFPLCVVYLPNMSTSLYFVVNDTFYNRALPTGNLPEGVIFGSLKEVAEQHPELVKEYYGQLADASKDGVTAFNTAFAQDGVVFYVPKNVVVEKTIQLVNILRADVNFMVNRRVLIILEDGAQARLLICDHAMDNVNFLATQVIEVFAGENAVFDMYELEETHTSTVRISNLYVKQEANSNVLLNGMTLHNGTTRNTTEVLLAGEGAEINLCGMAIADKNQHVDNHTSIDHAVPNCTSNELFKYVLDDQSVGAFAGLVLVRPDAQHTNSQQTNRNLCATRDARMYTQPQLEIYADDVKCSHGATVGQLDEGALFYMRSRGIAEKEARLLLMFAFVNEVIDTIRLEALKDRLHLLVEKRFRGELNRCQGCAICK